ncbi:hypothetical protein CANARDRAFT_192284 [[Candida] arabinofermentans NRRL YB-2248]|uniref:Uncharacterized protein n=1 Tax=[Candida] arabinofermentans NRRL YB-2248 TaxID=983967 RepID=A0A1E4T4F6_9ASCO|nr:hypothetical protein CANARDRAFT_192284 [[Candida] arabinofermentans NRRL YB-2248]
MWNHSNNNTMNNNLSLDKSIPLPNPPELDRKICSMSDKSLTNFLKLSRIEVDDNIILNLNSLITNENNNKSVKVKQLQCLNLINETLFPQWYERLKYINFCLNDTKKLEVEMNENNPINKLSKEEKDKLLNLNPYALKELNNKNNLKKFEIDQIKNKFENELRIEKIITLRSSEVINDHCKLINYDIKNEFIKYSTKLNENNK